MISTKGRYALRVMIDLAEHTIPDAAGQAGPASADSDGSSHVYIPLKDIAARQQISKKYLEIIVRELVEGGLIAGASGKGGGYRLLRSPEEYSVGEILETTEGTLSPVACLSSEENTCPRAGICKTLPLWTEYDAPIRSFFYGKTLADVAGTAKTT